MRRWTELLLLALLAVPLARSAPRQSRFRNFFLAIGHRKIRRKGLQPSLAYRLPQFLHKPLIKMKIMQCIQSRTENFIA